MNRIAALLIVLAGAVAVSGCGFRPIYATQEGASPISSQLYLTRVIAPENLAPQLREALDARIVSTEGVAPRYELSVQATESADRLAVQIDATVTRYNYRLKARYWLVDRETGQHFVGVARAVTSYNIVNSQYSTLFAERTAVEKAARLLAEEIERDILVRFSKPAEERDDIDAEEFEAAIDDDDALYFEPRRGKKTDTSPPEDLYSISPAEDGATDNTETSDATPDVPDPVIEE